MPGPLFELPTSTENTGTFEWVQATRRGRLWRWILAAVIVDVALTGLPMLIFGVKQPASYRHSHASYLGWEWAIGLTFGMILLSPIIAFGLMIHELLLFRESEGYNPVRVKAPRQLDW